MTIATRLSSAAALAALALVAGATAASAGVDPTLNNPANWEDGGDVVIVPSITDPEVLKAKFPKGYDAIKPYLRMTSQPNK